MNSLKFLAAPWSSQASARFSAPALARTSQASDGLRFYYCRPPNSDWEFYHAGDNSKTEDHLARTSQASDGLRFYYCRPRDKTPNPNLAARPCPSVAWQGRECSSASNS